MKGAIGGLRQITISYNRAAVALYIKKQDQRNILRKVLYTCVMCQIQIGSYLGIVLFLFICPLKLSVYLFKNFGQLCLRYSVGFSPLNAFAASHSR